MFEYNSRDLTIAQSPRMPSSLSFQHSNIPTNNCGDLWIHSLILATNISIHIPWKGNFEDDFPFPKVGYVSSLEGIYHRVIQNNKGLTLGPRRKNCQATLGWISPMILMCGTSHTPGQQKKRHRKSALGYPKSHGKKVETHQLTSLFLVVLPKNDTPFCGGLKPWKSLEIFINFSFSGLQQLSIVPNLSCKSELNHEPKFPWNLFSYYFRFWMSLVEYPGRRF